MKDFQDVLKKAKYKKITFKVSKTQHLLIKASINGVKGNFILDTYTYYDMRLNWRWYGGVAIQNIDKL